MSPAPITRTDPAAATGARETACSATASGSASAASTIDIPGAAVDDPRRDRDPLRERPVPPPLAVRDAQHAAVVAQVGQAPPQNAHRPQ